jgi:hypothetical protein
MDAAAVGGLELKVKPQGVFELGYEVRGNSPYDVSEAFDGHAADLLGLGFGRHPKAGLVCREQHLEPEHMGHVAGHRDDCDDSTTEARGCGVGAVVAHHDCGATFVGFGGAYRVQVDESDLTAPHR